MSYSIFSLVIQWSIWVSLTSKHLDCLCYINILDSMYNITKEIRVWDTLYFSSHILASFRINLTHLHWDRYCFWNIHTSMLHLVHRFPICILLCYSLTILPVNCLRFSTLKYRSIVIISLDTNCFFLYFIFTQRITCLLHPH